MFRILLPQPVESLDTQFTWEALFVNEFSCTHHNLTSLLTKLDKNKNLVSLINTVDYKVFMFFISISKHILSSKYAKYYKVFSTNLVRIIPTHTKATIDVEYNQQRCYKTNDCRPKLAAG